MRYGRYGWSYVCLRVGLGAVFLLIGIDMFRHPATWIGFLPQTIPFGIPRETALSANALFDAGIGILLIVGSLPRLAGLLAAVHLVSILVVHGVDPVLVRDVGLLGAALAVALWPQHRSRWWRWKSMGDEE